MGTFNSGRFILISYYVLIFYQPLFLKGALKGRRIKLADMATSRTFTNILDPIYRHLKHYIKYFNFPIFMNNQNLEKCTCQLSCKFPHLLPSSTMGNQKVWKVTRNLLITTTNIRYNYPSSSGQAHLKASLLLTPKF